LLFVFASLCIGRYPLTAVEVLQLLGQQIGDGATSADPTARGVLWHVRLPRALLGAMVGGALAISGTAFQALFRNPLVSSGILGVSSGAGFGAALAILLFNSVSAAYPFAFIFGILAVVFSYLIGRIYASASSSLMLVLGGVIVSSVFSALLSLVKYVADPTDQLPAIVFWLMGSLATARYHDLLISGIPMTVGIFALLGVRWRVNVLSMGDTEAHSLGVDPAPTRALVVLAATLATAGAVCVSGVIGWVGLVIPHIGRMLVGNDNRLLMPVSLSLGACFLIAVDNLARTLTGSEIPLGILTALVGGPFFVYLLGKTKGRGW
jgi:iron complex transport system permease protein